MQNKILKPRSYWKYKGTGELKNNREKNNEHFSCEMRRTRDVWQWIQ